MNFVYPLHTTTPNYTPFDPPLWKCFNKDWEHLQEQTNQHLRNVVLENGYIPVKTKLYHGSLLEKLDFKDKDRLTFFGLDIIISVWYVLEMLLYVKDGKEPVGYLYEFEVVIPLKTLLIEDITVNPKIIKERKDVNVYIHPQLSFHGDSTHPKSPYELCVETAFNMGYYRDYIKLIRVYKVDAKLLWQNRKKTFQQFDPVKALTPI